MAVKVLEKFFVRIGNMCVVLSLLTYSIAEQKFTIRKLKQLANKLCKNKQFLKDIIVNHRDFSVSGMQDYSFTMW